MMLSLRMLLVLGSPLLARRARSGGARPDAFLDGVDLGFGPDPGRWAIGTFDRPGKRDVLFDAVRNRRPDRDFAFTVGRFGHYDHALLVPRSFALYGFGDAAAHYVRVFLG